MRSSIFAAAIAALLCTFTTAASIQRRSDVPANWIPPDLYASGAPIYAGSPIVLKEPDDQNAQGSSTSNKWAMTYTPYTASGSCKSAAQVHHDVSIIASKGFTAVRLYATDCSSTQTVGAAAAEHGLKLVLGIYVGETGTNGTMVAEQLRSITEWATSPWTSPSSSSSALSSSPSSPSNDNKWAMVDLVVAGNEAIFNSFATSLEVAELLRHVRTTLRAAGYDGPVTTSEPVATLSQNAEELCPAIDVVAANLHPFFYADVTAQHAGAFVLEQMTFLRGVCVDFERDGQEDGSEPGRREAVALEVGWPRRGGANGLAVPGALEQRVAVRGMAEAIGAQAAFVSFEDDGWREEGEFGVERSWGCVGVF